MKKKASINIIVFTVGFCILVSWFYYEITKKKKILSKLSIEYPLIKAEESISGQITGMYMIDPRQFRINTNSLEITINDTLKRRLNVDNEIFTGKRLHDVLAIGDIVLKHGDSATATIFKIHGTDTLEFRFPLLNEKLHPLKK